MFPSKHYELNAKTLFSKILAAMLFIILAPLSLTACDSQTKQSLNEQTIATEQVENNLQNRFENYEIADTFIEIYDDKETQFQQFFLPDEYVKLCSVVEKMSAELCYAISSSCVLISQNVSTYNTNQNFYYVIDVDGNIVIDYADNYYVESGFLTLGDFTFIQTCFNPAKYDVVNQYGKILNSVEFRKHHLVYIKNLENGYYIFADVEKVSSTGYDLYILHPTGEYFEIHDSYKVWSANMNVDLSTEEYSLDADIGCNKDYTMISLCYERAPTTFAYYCDIYGNFVINLSSDETNFHVTELGDFLNGQAQIKFVGADKKKYIATIDENGAFINEPEFIT